MVGDDVAIPRAEERYFVERVLRVPGEVLVQTCTPGHPAITAIATDGTQAFVRGELAERRDAVAGEVEGSSVLTVRADVRLGEQVSLREKSFELIVAEEASNLEVSLADLSYAGVE